MSCVSALEDYLKVFLYVCRLANLSTEVDWSILLNPVC